jgi:hypothetical protein
VTLTGKHHSEELDDEAERLRLKAEAAVRATLSPVLVETARAAVAMAAEDGGRGIGEAAADIDALRTDPALADAMAKARLGAVVLGAIHDGLVAGWDVEAGFQEITAGVRIDPKGISDLLRRYPVMGHQPAEIAAHQSQAWQYAVDGVLGMAATSTAPVDLPAQMAAANDKAARDAGSAAAEAVAAGAQACRAAVGFGLQMKAARG